MTNIIDHKLKIDEFEEEVKAHFASMGWGANLTYSADPEHNVVLVTPLRSGLEIRDTLTEGDVNGRFLGDLEKMGLRYGVQLGISPFAYRIQMK